MSLFSASKNIQKPPTASFATFILRSLQIMAEAKGNDLGPLDEVAESFPRLLPDNCVEYFIYIIDTTIKDIEVRQRLRAVQSSATSYAKTLLKGYIWQRDSFQLELAQEKGENSLQISFPVT